MVPLGHRMLTAESERDLIRRHRAGDRGAGEAIARAFAGYATLTARALRPAWMDPGDAEWHAWGGLARMLRCFDPGRPWRMATVLKYCVLREVRGPRPWAARAAQFGGAGTRSLAAPGPPDEPPGDPGLIPAALATLSGRRRSVVVGRFGLGGAAPKTLREVGAEMGLSKERVRQIGDDALDDLRAFYAAAG